MLLQKIGKQALILCCSSLGKVTAGLRCGVGGWPCRLITARGVLQNRAWHRGFKNAAIVPGDLACRIDLRGCSVFVGTVGLGFCLRHRVDGVGYGDVLGGGVLGLCREAGAAQRIESLASISRVGRYRQGLVGVCSL